MVLEGDSKNKNDYISNIYDKFLHESKEFNHIKNGEVNYEYEADIAMRYKQYRTPHKANSPTFQSIAKNEYSLNKLKESFNNMTDTLRNIKKATKIRPK